MVKNWQSYMAKDPKKVRRRIYKGIPNMLRSQAWRYILDTERKKKRKAGLYQVSTFRFVHEFILIIICHRALLFYRRFWRAKLIQKYYIKLMLI